MTTLLLQLVLLRFNIKKKCRDMEGPGRVSVVETDAIQEKSQILSCKILKKKMPIPCESTAKELSFEWSRRKIFVNRLKS